MTTETGTRRAGDREREEEEREPPSPASDDDKPASTSSSSSPCWLVASTPYTGEPSARGLVASRKIRRGEVVEVAHCVVLSDYPFDDNDDGDDDDKKCSSPSKSDKDKGSKAKSTRIKSATMGLEHYVFFDRRGRSYCDRCPRRNRESSGDDDGPSSSRPSPVPSVRVLLALGAGSLFNHSSSPNVDWRAGKVESSEAPLVRREGDKACHWGKRSEANDKSDDGDNDALWPVVSFYAARDIERGEELTISYGKPWWEEREEEDDEEDDREDDVDVDGGGGGNGNGPKETRKKKQRPTHSHMDDEDAFLGAMTLGGGGEV